MKSEVYKQAKYYEIAFDFVDVPKQIDLFEKFITKFSNIPVRNVLDIACGPSLQLMELARRGYKCVGLDLNEEMLNYLKEKSVKEKLNMDLIKADMSKFNLSKKVDFAFILMGSIIYLKNNSQLVSHLNSMGKSLSSGGLYIIENLPMTWASSKIWESQEWDIEKDGIRIKATYKITLENELEQRIAQVIKLQVADNGKKTVLEDKDILKLVMPQEFKSIIKLQGDFEFIGFFERWGLKKLAKSDPDNLVVLRRN